MFSAAVLLAYAPELLTQRQGAFDRVPLHEALIHRREDLVRLFLKVSPALINTCDGYGWYPFHYALNLGNWKLLVLLLNVPETVSEGNLRDLVGACERESQTGGRLSRYVAEQISKQMNCIRVGLGER